MVIWDIEVQPIKLDTKSPAWCYLRWWCRWRLGYASKLKLLGSAIASLRVRFRHPTILKEAVFDVLAGIAYLESERVEAIALTGQRLSPSSHLNVKSY